MVLYQFSPNVQANSIMLNAHTTLHESRVPLTRVQGSKVPPTRTKVVPLISVLKCVAKLRHCVQQIETLFAYFAAQCHDIANVPARFNFVKISGRTGGGRWKILSILLNAYTTHINLYGEFPKLNSVTLSKAVYFDHATFRQFFYSLRIKTSSLSGNFPR